VVIEKNLKLIANGARKTKASRLFGIKPVFERLGDSA
jgi:hypothetical protein